VSIAPDTSKLDLPALSHKLAAADLGGCRHQLINEQLLDVRGWRQLPPDEIEARLKAEPLALLAAWELTDAVAHLNQATLSEKKFLKPFTSRKLLKRMAYLAFEVPTTELPQLPRTMLVTRSSVWDGLLFLHNVVRWALRFGALRKYDLRQFKQLNLRYPFAITIGAQPVDAVEAAIFTVLRELGIAWVEWDPQIAGHHLETWLCEHLAVNHDIEQKKQQRLEFREAGGTENSLFVVRAMGGVDGCLVRGQIERDLGLIIDIVVRVVTKSATAYL